MPCRFAPSPHHLPSCETTFATCRSTFDNFGTHSKSACYGHNLRPHLCPSWPHFGSTSTFSLRIHLASWYGTHVPTFLCILLSNLCDPVPLFHVGCHLDHILVPSWPHFAPSWFHLDRPLRPCHASSHLPPTVFLPVRPLLLHAVEVLDHLGLFQECTFSFFVPHLAVQSRHSCFAVSILVPLWQVQRICLHRYIAENKFRCGRSQRHCRENQNLVSLRSCL